MFKFVIDAGHGYHTSGKRTPDGTMHEWEFNNAVALKIRQKLSEYKNVAVLLTADVTGKRDVPLRERTNKANDWGATAFISVHANAIGTGGWNDSQGIETFVYSSRPRESLSLAEDVHRMLLASARRKNRGVKSANFHVLRESKMPAILVECGFMTNREEANLLKSGAYREACAQGIVNGLVAHYGLIRNTTAAKKPAAPAPTPSKEVNQKLNLSDWQFKELADAFQYAYDKKLFSSDEHAKEARDHTIDRDQLLFLAVSLWYRTHRGS